MRSQAWTFRAQLPDPEEFGAPLEQLIVQEVRQFMVEYMKLRTTSSEAVLLKRLDAVAKTGHWLKETARRVTQLLPERSLRANSIALAHESFAQSLAAVKISLAHISRDDAIAIQRHSISLPAFSRPERSSAQQQLARENATLLAAAQVFLWTVQGAVNSGTFSPTVESRRAATRKN